MQRTRECAVFWLLAPPPPPQQQQQQQREHAHGTRPQQQQHADGILGTGFFVHAQWALTTASNLHDIIVQHRSSSSGDSSGGGESSARTDAIVRARQEVGGALKDLCFELVHYDVACDYALLRLRGRRSRADCVLQLAAPSALRNDAVILGCGIGIHRLLPHLFSLGFGTSPAEMMRVSQRHILLSTAIVYAECGAPLVLGGSTEVVGMYLRPTYDLHNELDRQELVAHRLSAEQHALRNLIRGTTGDAAIAVRLDNIVAQLTLQRTLRNANS